VQERLRDSTAGTVEAADEDVLLIGKLVNDATRRVADAHNWQVQEYEWTINTTADQANYSLTGSANRGIIEDVRDMTRGAYVRAQSRRWYRQQELANLPAGTPSHWIPNGIDGSGDNEILLYPTPNDTRTLSVTGYFKPVADMTADTDSTTLPREPIETLAWAYAARERGEVGGQVAGEIFSIAKASLADAIAYDLANQDYEEDWYTV
jgi:hypothetical protein